ncbi:MAG: type VII toxin-antitoxin system MntA family adenylyltransferase antitoxin [Acidobacteriota bacterium]
MTKRKKIELDKLIEKAGRDKDILAVLLFGSSVREKETSKSDVDICLIMTPETQASNQKKLINSQKRLDYLKDFLFDIHIFQQLPLYIRKRILKEGKILFVRDEDKLYEIAFRTAQAYEDFKHIYHDYLKEIADVGF